MRAEVQIREQLRLMNREQSCDGFHFDDDQVFDDEVQPVAGAEGNSLVRSVAAAVS